MDDIRAAAAIRSGLDTAAGAAVPAGVVTLNGRNGAAGGGDGDSRDCGDGSSIYLIF